MPDLYKRAMIEMIQSSLVLDYDLAFSFVFSII